LHTVGGRNIGTAIMENSMKFFKKLKIQLLYDLAIPLLGIYPKKMNQPIKDICNSMFIAVLFISAKYGNNLGVYQRMNGSRKYDVYVQ
jgi:hypothetical protein